MLSYLRKQSLPHQLSAETFIAVVFFMSLLIYYVSRYFTSEVNSVAYENQSKQIQLVSHNLEARFDAMVATNDTISDMFLAELSGVELTPDNYPSVVGELVPGLKIGSIVLNENDSLLKRFAKSSDHLVSVYVRKEKRFIKVASSYAKQEQAFNAHDVISPSHNGYSKLLIGRSYQAQIQQLGLNLYQTLTPIRVNGEVIAILETSTNLSHIMKNLSDYVNQLKFGRTGYVYVLAAGESEGDLVIHKTLVGMNVYDVQPEFRETFEQAFKANEGSFSYAIPVDGIDTQARQSKVLFHAIKGWNWVALLKTYEDEYQSEIDAQILKIELMCLAGVIFLMLVLWLLIRRSLSPLQEITTGLSRLGEGDLTYQFKQQKLGSTKNEMHLLKRDIGAMRDGLVKVVKQVTSSSENLVNSADSIGRVSAELQMHAKKSEDECVHVATAINQVASSIEDVAHSTRAVSDETSAASDLSMTGNDAVEEVEETVANLAQAFNTASKRIKDVEDSSNSIGEVVDVINSIAEQTNLLALNAAIEAARAGEQGRGFAVVADEVRNLAHKTQDSTRKIRDVVEKLQENSQSAVKGMEDGAEQVALSVSKATNAGILLTQIRESILAVEKSMAQVSNATEEQRVAVKKISDSSKSLTQSSSDTFAHSQSSSDQGENVKGLSDTLLKNISAFKVT